MKKKLTVTSFRQKKEKQEKITALTAYDTATAVLAESCGIDLILVGDSLGMTVLGYENTVPVTLDDMLHHSKAVVRSTSNSFIVTDMPFMTYQISPEQAMENATRCLQEAGVDAVKIEGGSAMAPTVKRLTSAGIPVLCHIGLLPQSILTSGGYKIVGKTENDAKQLLEDAKALEDAGAFSLVLEGIPANVSKQISEALTIPTIGIGGGIHCDGQIQVINDILGLFSSFVPKHSKQYANLSEVITTAISSYISDVQAGTFPGKEHSF